MLSLTMILEKKIYRNFKNFYIIKMHIITMSPKKIKKKKPNQIIN